MMKLTWQILQKSPTFGLEHPTAKHGLTCTEGRFKINFDVLQQDASIEHKRFIQELWLIACVATALIVTVRRKAILDLCLSFKLNSLNRMGFADMPESTVSFHFTK